MQSLLDAQSVVLQEHEAHAATAKSSLKRRLEARRKKLRDELETLFNMIDSDGSGTITGAELQVALPHVAAGELQSLIAEFDTNGDGVFAHCG
jgi:Ca2+-binding EF-hand superfamily protein